MHKEDGKDWEGGGAKETGLSDTNWAADTGDALHVNVLSPTRGWSQAHHEAAICSPIWQGEKLSQLGIWPRVSVTAVKLDPRPPHSRASISSTALRREKAWRTGPVHSGGGGVDRRHLPGGCQWPAPLRAGGPSAGGLTWLPVSANSWQIWLLRFRNEKPEFPKF